MSLDFTEEQEYTIYFKDALGNTQSQTLTPSKLDKTGPSIEVSEKSDENGAVLDITFEDLKSGLEEYKIVEPGENEEEKEWTKLKNYYLWKR